MYKVNPSKGLVQYFGAGLLGFFFMMKIFINIQKPAEVLSFCTWDMKYTVVSSQPEVCDNNGSIILLDKQRL